MTDPAPPMTAHPHDPASLPTRSAAPSGGAERDGGDGRGSAAGGWRRVGPRPPAASVPVPPPVGRLSWRMLAAGPVVAVLSMVAALVATDQAGVPLRDPDNVAGGRLLLVLALVGALVVLDIGVRAARRAGTWTPPRVELGRVRRERWTARRGVAVGTALVSFYATYLAYRNLKSVVPLIRPDVLFDRQLEDIDRALFLGHDPAALLHGLLGTGAATEVLAVVYGIFFLYIPGTLALALVFSPNLRAGIFYVTAQSLNWLIGAASYFVLPSLGPIYAEPGVFAGMPPTGVSHLQAILIDQRMDFIRDPINGAAAQSIAAFSSLHISIFFTGALTAHLLGLHRWVRVTAWVLLGLTALATIHLGWHYVVDDVAGVALGVAAVAIAAVMTGFDPRRVRAAVRADHRPSPVVPEAEPT